MKSSNTSPYLESNATPCRKNERSDTHRHKPQPEHQQEQPKHKTQTKTNPAALVTEHQTKNNNKQTQNHTYHNLTAKQRHQTLL